MRITDRGPFVDGRIIDLSHAAARTIEMIGPGIANVQLTIVSRPPEMPAVNLFAVQVGAFQERERAERVRSEFEQQYGTARLVFRAGNPAVWRVLVGREESSDAAARLAGPDPRAASAGPRRAPRRDAGAGGDPGLRISRPRSHVLYQQHSPECLLPTCHADHLTTAAARSRRRVPAHTPRPKAHRTFRPVPVAGSAARGDGHGQGSGRPCHP